MNAETWRRRARCGEGDDETRERKRAQRGTREGGRRILASRSPSADGIEEDAQSDEERPGKSEEEQGVVAEEKFVVWAGGVFLGMLTEDRVGVHVVFLGRCAGAANDGEQAKGEQPDPDVDEAAPVEVQSV